MSLFPAASNVNKPSGTNEGPYPINRPFRETDGPTERIEERGRRRRDRLAWFGLLIAVFALVAALISALAGWQAMRVSHLMAATKGTINPETHDDGTGYHVAYAQEPLKVRVGCSAVLFVDLDEPRSNADERVSDLRYDSRCGLEAPRLALGPGAAAGAEVTGLDLDAAGCERAVRTSPIGPGGSVEVRKGVVLCVLTAADPASMALVEVTDVGRTGTAGMRATSWKVAG